MSDEREFVTLNGLAKAVGITHKSAQKHRDSGLWKPVTHGQNAGRFDLRKCVELFQMARDPIAVSKGEAAREAAEGSMPAVSGNPLVQARTMSMVYEARQRELRFKKARGELIDREEARRACRAVISVVNERIEGAASQIAVRVAGIASTVEIERIVKDTLRQVRQEIAGLGTAVEMVASG